MHRVQHSPQQALAQSTGVPHVPITHITTEAGKQVAPVHSRLTFNFAILLLYRSTDDRQSGTLPSRPGEPEYAVMSGAWLLEGTFEAYLYRGMFLEQLSNAMRGSEIRGIELADRFCKSYGTVRPVAAVAVGSLKMNGKTNQVRMHPAHIDFRHCHRVPSAHCQQLCE